MGAGSGIVGAFIIICLIVCIAVACFPNVGWPLWLVAICTVVFWIVIGVMVAVVVVVIIGLIWMSV
jgi:hypothetical protein